MAIPPQPPAPGQADPADRAPEPRRRRFGRWTAPQHEVEADELARGSADSGATAVCDCRVGQPATVAGRLRSVTLRPRSGVPALVAELFDGSGTVQLVWLGRRRIRGVEPGRHLMASGRMTRQGDQLTLFNPRYELAPKAGE